MLQWDTFLPRGKRSGVEELEMLKTPPSHSPKKHLTNLPLPTYRPRPNHTKPTQKNGKTFAEVRLAPWGSTSADQPWRLRCHSLKPPARASGTSPAKGGASRWSRWSKGDREGRVLGLLGGNGCFYFGGRGWPYWCCLVPVLFVVTFLGDWHMFQDIQQKTIAFRPSWLGRNVDMYPFAKERGRLVTIPIRNSEFSLQHLRHDHLFRYCHRLHICPVGRKHP